MVTITNGKPPVLVIVQLTGGNDFMNTLIPYTSGLYHDVRPVVGVSEDRVLPINDELGFHPVENPVHVHDVQATILHCLGIDHRRLNFRFRGLNFRLTGVEEHEPIAELLA
mgnify:CR=1 FL=1